MYGTQDHHRTERWSTEPTETQSDRQTGAEREGGGERERLRERERERERILRFKPKKNLPRTGLS